MFWVRGFVFVLVSRTSTVTLVLPAAVGVPEMTPVPLLSLSPFGRWADPRASFHV
jgi:hypothetical protein